MKTITYIIIGVLLMAGIYFLFINSVSILKIDLINKSGDVVYQENFKIPFSASQSVLGFPDNLSLMSTVPITEDTHLSNLNLPVKNPFNEEAAVNVEVKKSDMQIKLLTTTLKSKEERILALENIDLRSGETTKTPIDILTTYKNKEGNKIISTLHFVYIYLTPCVQDLDCQYPVNKCDRANLGGFSPDFKVSYCTTPCIKNDNCNGGQSCRKGICGY